MTLPIPGTKDAPEFNGENVQEFLRRYNDMCSVLDFSEEKKVEKLIYYVAPSIRPTIEKMNAYTDKKFTDLKKELLSEFGYLEKKPSVQDLFRRYPKLTPLEYLKEYQTLAN